MMKQGLLFMVLLTDARQYVALLKINPAVSAKDALSKIEPVFKKFNPDNLLNTSLLMMIMQKNLVMKNVLESLPVFLPYWLLLFHVLGLFGLTSFVAEQRKKEIGVRKVLGASVFNVWNLLSKDFVMLVIISFLLLFRSHIILCITGCRIIITARNYHGGFFQLQALVHY